MNLPTLSLPRWFFSLSALMLLISITENSHASRTYSPSDVYAGVEYATRIVDEILISKKIDNLQVPRSREKAVKPMHVYELHITALSELYHYALKQNRRPPPLTTSSPINYTPTDVYYLTQLLINNVEEIHRDTGGEIDFTLNDHTGKSPAHVYQKLFELYYKLKRLNGFSKVSPSEVYAQIYRAKEDLQTSLLTLSKRLEANEEDKKRLLVTAIYGMHPDGTVMPAIAPGKKPGDVLEKVLEVRSKLNTLRTANKLSEIKIPDAKKFGQVKPIDILLQTQFIIAELNLLKMPMVIHSTTNSSKPATDKTPSDVYYEMEHIDYMLERLLRVL
ncbi:hypothetical protein MNBD_GAMMA21-2481 [hydrothermal vent metagenome]|uniref:Uncharacterized protein n=1 Tax=hydrothermal vent metagenome TaxID=652676 RepID=A0A3B1ALD6_9ZZZZ